MELDVWVPEKRMAFEYQGEQHYHNLEEIFGKSGKLDLSTIRDHRKQERCAQMNIDLVLVPYWWNDSSATLQDIIDEITVIIF